MNAQDTFQAIQCDFVDSVDRSLTSNIPTGIATKIWTFHLQLFPPPMRAHTSFNVTVVHLPSAPYMTRWERRWISALSLRRHHPITTFWKIITCRQALKHPSQQIQWVTVEYLHQFSGQSVYSKFSKLDDTPSIGSSNFPGVTVKNGLTELRPFQQIPIYTSPGNVRRGTSSYPWPQYQLLATFGNSFSPSWTSENYHKDSYRELFSKLKVRLAELLN